MEGLIVGVVYLLCTKTGNACGFQRYCTNDQCIKHTNNFVNCALRKGVDTQMSKKNKNKTITEATVTTKSIENVGEGMRTTKKCKVILVTPNYFIIDNDGFAQRIQGKTDLKKGDWYTLELIPKEKEVVIEEKVEVKAEEAVVEEKTMETIEEPEIKEE